MIRSGSPSLECRIEIETPRTQAGTWLDVIGIGQALGRRSGPTSLIDQTERLDAVIGAALMRAAAGEAGSSSLAQPGVSAEKSRYFTGCRRTVRDRPVRPWSSPQPRTSLPGGCNSVDFAGSGDRSCLVGLPGDAAAMPSGERSQCQSVARCTRC